MASPDVEVSPSDLRFRFQLNKQLLATITINNPNSQRVAFKIKTTAPKKYVVRPSSGIVEPRSNVSIQVIMQAQKEYAPEFANCKDKFMVQTTALGETEQIEKDTFNKDVRRDLKEYRLRVTIESPAAPPSPVPEANEADDESGRNAVQLAGTMTGTVAPDAVPDGRLRTTLDDLAAVTAENKQLKAQTDRLQRERNDLRRQLDTFHLSQRAPPSQAAKAAKASGPSGAFFMVIVLLTALIAFLLGHYLRF